jgi:hypothetical protein
MFRLGGEENTIRTKAADPLLASNFDPLERRRGLGSERRFGS